MTTELIANEAGNDTDAPKKTNPHITARAAFSDDCKCKCICGYLILPYLNRCGHHTARLARDGITSLPAPDTYQLNLPSAVKQSQERTAARAEMRRIFGLDGKLEPGTTPSSASGHSSSVETARA